MYSRIYKQVAIGLKWEKKTCNVSHNLKRRFGPEGNIDDNCTMISTVIDANTLSSNPERTRNQIMTIEQC